MLQVLGCLLDKAAVLHLAVEVAGTEQGAVQHRRADQHKAGDGEHRAQQGHQNAPCHWPPPLVWSITGPDT